MTTSKIQMDQIRSTSATVAGENIRAGSQKKSSLSPAEGLQGASPDATCTCPSGDGSLVHPCPAHPAPVEQAGGDERVVGWRERILAAHPNSDPGFWPDALLVEHMAAEIADLRAALAQPSTKCATCNGSGFVEFERGAVIKDCPRCHRVAQPSPAPELAERGTQHRFSTTEQTCQHDFAGVWWNDNGETKTGRECRHCGFFVADVIKAQAEQAEAERPPQPERYTADVFHPERPYYMAQTSVVRASDFDEFATQYERIVGALRFERQQMDRAFTACINERDAANARLHEVATACATAEQERDAALAEVERLRQFERICEGLPQDAIDGGWTVQGIRAHSKQLEEQLKVALARVAELEKQEPAGAPMPDEIHQMAFEEGQPADDGDGYLFSAEEFDLFVQRLLDSCAAPVAQAQHSAGYAEARMCANCRHIGINDAGADGNCPECGGFYELEAQANVPSQAQHSVPEGFREKFKQCMELAFAEIAYYVSPEKARDPNSRARKAGALATELHAILAAAPGKERV